MTRVTGDWLDAPATQAVLAMLEAGGHRALTVGGCVRNALMGLAVEDVDIATDAPPERVSELAEAAGLKPVPTGIAHGTITVVSGGEGFEVTTFRRDAETFGRHARVEFGAALEDDAARRDFTMNALYARADGTLVDPLGGLPDVLARRVRFVGRPEDRIHEDALRILRFFRFLARYGDPSQPPDAQALAACAAGLGRLARVSAERVGHEMRKLLAARDPGPAVAAMAATGVLETVLPGAGPGVLARLLALEPALPGFGQGAVPRWLPRLAALGGHDPAEALRLSRAEAGTLARLDRHPGAPPHELGYRLGAAEGLAALALGCARSGTRPPTGALVDLSRGAQARFPLKPADLMPALQGPALGRALARAEAHWIAHGFAPDAAELRTLALGI